MTDQVSELVGDSDNIRMTDPVSELVGDSDKSPTNSDTDLSF
jgi:hypothetical protein